MCNNQKALWEQTLNSVCRCVWLLKGPEISLPEECSRDWETEAERLLKGQGRHQDWDQGPETGLVIVGWGGTDSTPERPGVQTGIIMNVPW